MYFKKYNEFLNEDRASRLKRREERKLEKAKNNTSGTTSGTVETNKPEVKDESGITNDTTNSTSDTSKPEIKDETKNTNQEVKDSDKKVESMSPEELNKKLSEWNSIYGQQFKFKNNMPNSVLKNVAELKNSLSNDRQVKAIEGLRKVVSFFKNSGFNNQKVEISGYTSTPATNQHNDSLSKRRAESVKNVIMSLMKDENITTNIEFITVGHGEDPKHLLIINDTESDNKLNLSNRVGNKSDFNPDNFKTPESRQEINRRVELKISNLPYLPIIPEIPKVEDKVEDKVEEPVAPPKTPKPSSIEFNYDSYILTQDSEDLLTSFTENLKKYINADNKVKEIYISSHTLKAEEDNPKEQELQAKNLFILSTNRAYTVKRYIQKELGEIGDDITFYVYPVSFNMSVEKKVVIEFTKTPDMERAETVFTDLATKYDIPKNKYGYAGSNYAENDALRKSLLYNLKQLVNKNLVMKKIPLELWYKGKRFGLGYEKDLDQFKEKITNILAGSEKSKKPTDYIYTSL